MTMDNDAQLKLQAYLDGELPEGEARVVANWLAKDQEAVALLAEMRQTRKAIAGFEDGVRLPESREFYWSKIRREIERLETPASVAPRVPFILRLRRVLMPAAAVAAVGLFAFVFVQGNSGSGGFGSETAFADSGAFTYHDYKEGATLVWLPYPAEEDVADEPEMGKVDTE
jgi:anti-sigma factor RsiW